MILHTLLLRRFVFSLCLAFGLAGGAGFAAGQDAGDPAQPPPPSQAIQDAYRAGTEAWSEGRTYDALVSLRDALAIARDERADTDGVTRFLLRAVARAELEFALYDSAEALVLEANAAVRRIHSDRHPELSDGYALLARIWERQRRHAEARDAYDTAINLARLDLSDALRAGLLYGRGQAALALDDLQAAEADFRHSLTRAETAYGSEDANLSAVLEGLGKALYGQERWDDARPVLERRLAIDEVTFGADQAGTGTALAELGFLEWRAGNNARSMRFYQRAVAAQEKNLGPDAPTVGLSLSMLSHAASGAGHFGTAADASIRALTILQESGLESAAETRQRRTNIAYLQQRAGRLEEARVLYTEILGDRPDPEQVATFRWELASILLRLGDAYALETLIQDLKVQIGADPNALKKIADAAYWDLQLGMMARAAVKLRTVLEMAEEEQVTPDWDRAQQLETLGQAYLQLDALAPAEKVLVEALTLREAASNEDSWSLAGALELNAGLARKRHDLSTARALLTRAIQLREQSSRPLNYNLGDQVVALGALNAYADLAALHQLEGDAYAAEPLLRKALLFAESSYGTDHAWVAPFIVRLAEAYGALGDFSGAAALYSRALRIMEPSIELGSVDALPLLADVGWFLTNGGQAGEALPIAEQALEIGEAAYGPNSRSIVGLLLLMAEIRADLGDRDAALPLLQRSVEILQDQPDDPLLADVLHMVAEWHLEEHEGQGSDAKDSLRTARDALNQGLAIIRARYGPDHPSNAIYYDDLARVAHLEQDPENAVALGREAIRLSRLRAEGAARHKQDEDVRQLRADRSRFLAHIRHLRAADRGGTLFDEGFETAQLAGESATASALRRTTARMAAGDDALAAEIRTMQAARAKAALLDAELLAALALPASDRDWRIEEKLRQDVAAARSAALLLSDKVAADFPRYGALIQASPVAARDVQASLRPDEAYLLYRVDKDALYIWLLRRDRRALVVLEQGSETIEALVAGVRETLEPRGGKPPRFAVRASRRLYDILIAPVADRLEGVEHLIVTPDRALQSLPFDVLIAQKPARRVARLEDYAGLAWLGDNYAITVAPTPASLLALRNADTAAAADIPLIGIGDPVLHGAPGPGSRSARGTLFAPTGLADPAAVRKMAPLPETADELIQIAALLGADEDALYLRQRAVEPVVRAAPLSRAQVLVFATHGLLAGEFPGMDEPALVLTPPDQASPADDGLLSAGEIATLNLDAQMVILSACNTAAPDGTPGAEGLSGLARAFFHAGARSLLVSHWPVESRSAALLTTRMIEELAETPGLSRGEALRRSARRLRNDPDRPHYAHPAYWAPFSVVGGGSAG